LVESDQERRHFVIVLVCQFFEPCDPGVHFWVFELFECRRALEFVDLPFEVFETKFCGQLRKSGGIRICDCGRVSLQQEDELPENVDRDGRVDSVGRGNERRIASKETAFGGCLRNGDVRLVFGMHERQQSHGRCSGIQICDWF
jgi:hypothetical protein